MDERHLPEIDYGACRSYVKVEGMYHFGGIDGDGHINSRLHILQLGSDENKWVEPRTKGLSPCERYEHCLVRMERTNSLLLHGERNKRNTGLGAYLSDVWMLYMDSLTWT